MAYMVKMEEEYSKFWEISLDENVLTTTYGVVGDEGVSRSKEMYDQDEAVECLVQSVLTKYERGYKLDNKKRKLEDFLQDQQKISRKRESSEEKSEKSSPRSSGNNNRRKKRGLSGAPPPDVSKPLGYVDPESCLCGDLYRDSKGSIFDVMLVKQNQTTDNYYIIQLVQNKNEDKSEYKIYLRWGRVDTAGQCQILHPKNLQEALELFEDKFWDKTGTEWSLRHTQLPLLDMYEWIKPPTQIRKKQKNSQQQFQLVQEPRSIENTSVATNEERKVIDNNEEHNYNVQTGLQENGLNNNAILIGQEQI